MARLTTANSIRVYYERDSAYLGLIGSFIQDAPQLMLQIYILAVKHKLTDDLSNSRVGAKHLEPVHLEGSKFFTTFEWL